MLLIVSFRYPGLPGAAHTALRVLLLAAAWSAACPAALALVVAVCVAVAPHLPTLAAGTSVTGLYAVATCPRKKVRA
jgi:hypothetical protein